MFALPALDVVEHLLWHGLVGPFVSDPFGTVGIHPPHLEFGREGPLWEGGDHATGSRLDDLGAETLLHPRREGRGGLERRAYAIKPDDVSTLSLVRTGQRAL